MPADPSCPPDAGRRDATIAPPIYQLVVFSGAEARTFDLPPLGEVTIGRGEGNAVRIDDPAVSRRHAVIHVGERLEIEDLSGGNGIFIREKAIAATSGKTLNVRQIVRQRADLALGDRMLLGTASIVVRLAPNLEVPDLDGPEVSGAGVIVRDPAMQTLYRQAARAARAPITVLLLGETGVGKEVLARAIHTHSPRAKGPFIGINCAALAESLLESELFGNEKGAFTGAVSARAGLFEAAEGGTVFLDEVGELPLPTQSKLLRVLEERLVTRLGSTRARPIDVRFVAATNRDIEADSRTGRFRSDLFFRLAGISLVIPPLRERPAEIELLVERFVTAACRAIERPASLAVSPDALQLLREYRWPGNIRELRNVIERAVVLCVGDTVLPEDLPVSLQRAGAPASASTVQDAASVPNPGDPPVSKSSPASEADVRGLADQIKSLERARISEALERCGGNQSRAAELLGIARRTLVSRLAEFDLPRPRKPSSRA